MDGQSFGDGFEAGVRFVLEQARRENSALVEEMLWAARTCRALGVSFGAEEALAALARGLETLERDVKALLPGEARYAFLTAQRRQARDRGCEDGQVARLLQPAARRG